MHTGLVESMTASVTDSVQSNAASMDVVDLVKLVTCSNTFSSMDVIVIPRYDVQSN